jgi:plastocyanin
VHRTTTLSLALATALGLAGTAAAAPPKLFGTVGPGFTITLKDAKGKTVKTLKAGKYTIVVSDKSSIHDFHLTGPGVDAVITGIGFTGTRTVTLTLRKGKYSFVCDPHSSTMHGGFAVK